MKKSIFAYINAETEYEGNVLNKARAYEQNGADGLYLYNYDRNEQAQESFLDNVRAIMKQVDIPLYIGCVVKRFEDVKKALYTGATCVVVKYDAHFPQEEVVKAIERFGKDKVLVEFNTDIESDADEFRDISLLEELKEIGVCGFIFKHVTPDNVAETVKKSPLPVMIRDSLIRNDVESLLSMENVSGVLTNYYVGKNIQRIKSTLKDFGLDTKCLESAIPFSEFKLGPDGLIPVVVQDYKTCEVLMVAYMK